MQRAFSSILVSTFPLATLSCLIPLSAQAQVTPDGTTSTTVNKDGNDFTIEQGNRVGDNLFHSFNEFSVPTFGSAAFNNAGDIANIFSRVTGNNISSIDGLISANGAANLFLINPNGIIFGENASLNLGGSFFASTADSLLFEGDAEFSAVNPQAAPLLEVNIPIGARFRDNPGDIIVNTDIDSISNSFISVDTGQSITLLGGNLSLNQGVLFAPDGKIELGGLTETGKIDIVDSSLKFPKNIARGNINLNNYFVDVTNTGTGKIELYGQNISLTSGSFISNGIAPGLVDNDDIRIEGDININATGSISSNQASSIQNQIFNNASGNTGDINIETNSLNLSEGSRITTSSFGNGNGGNVIINTRDNIIFDGFGNEGIPSGIFSNLGAETSVGNAGDIQINTSELSLTNGGVVNSTTFGQGNAGKVSINGTNLFINGEAEDPFFNSSISSGVANTGVGNAGGIDIKTSNLTIINGGLINGRTGGIGNGGNIKLQVDSLSLENDSRIDASTFNQGNAGNITINATDNILLDTFSGIGSEIVENAVGDSAGIDITTANLSLNRGGLISTNNLGAGNTGNININATNNIILAQMSGIGSLVEENAVGNSGKIEITTNNLSLTEGSLIDTSSLGQGNAEKITINASGEISIDGINSVIFNEINDNAEGNSEGIEIVATNLFLSNGGSINSNSSGNGNSGKISLDVAETLSIDSGSSIFNAINGNSNGRAEAIDISTNNLFITNGGQINSNTSGRGNAGNITLDIENSIEVFGLDETTGTLSGISTETISEGNAGNINLFARSLTLKNTGMINSSTSGIGNGGNITLNLDDFITLSDEGVIISNSFGFSGTITNRFESGDSGNINIQVESLSLNNGSRISSGVTGVVFATPGNISIDVDGSISLAGENQNGTPSSISSDTNGLEDAGNIDIQADSLFLGNGANISVNNDLTGFSNGGNISISVDESIVLNGMSRDGSSSQIVANALGGNSGGNIEIQASSLFLNNGAELSSIIERGMFSDPASGSGGNITLEISEVLSFSNNGSISARANDNANGGNITINAKDGLIIAFPNQNNDIVANASEGQGGAIDIATQAIFGLEERPSTPPNFTNDIDASSEFGLQGDLSLNTPDFDPTTGLINLPTSVGDASDQISQNPCEQGVGSQFIVTGKGGLPPTVNESLNSEESRIGLIEAVPSQRERKSAIRRQVEEINNQTTEVTPAQGWVFNDKGEVTLTAYKTSEREIQRSSSESINSCSAQMDK